MMRGEFVALTLLLSFVLPSHAAAAIPAFHAVNVGEQRSGIPATASLSGCFEIGVDYPGNDIKQIIGGVVGLPQLCQAICAETPKCDLFTWDSKTSNCYLKRANSRDYRQRDATTALLISGPRECNSSYYGICLEFNVDYEGHDVEQISDNNVFSAAHCQLLCEQKATCFFFTWQSQTRTCYLKGPTALLGRKQSTSNALLVSGPKKCWIGTPEKNLCFDYGVDYYGYDVESLQTVSRETPEHCQTACQQAPACFYWSWEPTATGNLCFLKDKRALQGRKCDITTHHFVSGPKKCSPSVCFERDVDYMGADIEKIEDGTVADATACQQRCAGTAGCTFFTYVPAHRWCYLKGNQALIGWRKDAQTQGSVSGPRECLTPHAESTCYEHDVTYEGHTLMEIENGKVDSAAMCQQFCAHYGLCTHWTWDSQRFYCYLRSASALLGWKKDYTTRGFVSGPKNCRQAALVGCQENNVDYEGSDIVKYEDGRVRNPATCQILCQVTLSCAYWTWTKETRGCYLKDKKALKGRKEVPKELGVASGPKFCSVAPPGCFESDVDYSGHNVAKVESGRCSSAPICQSLCQKTTGCAYWTWVSATKSCYLKNTYAIHARRHDVASGGMVSGPAFCPQEPACTENGVDYTGYDVGKVEDSQVTTPEVCRSLCQNSEACRYWSWVSTTRSCYLKGAYGLLGRREDADTKEIVSGPKYCCPAPPECHEIGYSYWGYDVKKIETGSVHSADTCRSLCQMDPECYFWTWDSSTHNCYLKDQYAPLGRTPDPHATSGSWQCSNRYTGSCIEEGVTYEGRDLLGPSASATRKFQSFGDQYNGALICQTQCQATPGCHYWSFDRAGQRCFLKDQHAPGGRIRNPATKYFISGHKDCVPKAPDCHEQDIDYRGFDLRKIETEQVWSYQMCQEICRATDGCHFWTWDSRTRNCYLKTEQALVGRVRDHLSRGVISGPKHCQMTVSCFEADVEYAGYTLQQLEDGFLQTAAQCQAVCKLRPRCEYWTWISASKTCHLKTAGALSGRKQDGATTGMVSGPKSCIASPECYEIDIDYYGNDVQKIEDGRIASSGECQRLCQLHPDCYYFTYLTDLHFCYLKSFGAAANRVGQVSAVSGPKSCSVPRQPPPPPPAGRPCVDYNEAAPPSVLCPYGGCNRQPPTALACTDGTGSNRLPPPPVYCPMGICEKPLPPAVDCAGGVCAKPPCTASHCSNAPHQPTRPVHDPSHPLECFEYGVVYVADFLPATYRANSLAECHYICLREPRAKAFSFNTHSLECILQTVCPADAGGRLKKLPAQGVVSGPKHCPDEVPMRPGVPTVVVPPPPLPFLPPDIIVPSFPTASGPPARSPVLSPERILPDAPSVPTVLPPAAFPIPPPDTTMPSAPDMPTVLIPPALFPFPPPEIIVPNVTNFPRGQLPQSPLTLSPSDMTVPRARPAGAESDLHPGFSNLQQPARPLHPQDPVDLYEDCYVIAVEYGGTNVLGETNLSDGRVYASFRSFADNLDPYVSSVSDAPFRRKPYLQATCPEQCQQQCVENPDCFYWSFENDTQRCLLKAADAVTSGVVNVNVVSGPKHCSTVY